MIHLIPTIVLLAAASLVVWKVEPVLNRMGRSHQTPMHLFMSFLLILVGAVALFIGCLAGWALQWPASILLLGVALLMVCDRRARYLAKRSNRELPP